MSPKQENRRDTQSIDQCAKHRTSIVRWAVTALVLGLVATSGWAIQNERRLTTLEVDNRATKELLGKMDKKLDEIRTAIYNK